MSQNQIVSVSFHNETVFAIIVDGKPLVPMTPICKNLGLDWEPQRKRIQRHPVLKTSTSMMEVQMPGDDQIRQVTCLPLSMLNGWLFGVDVNRVKPALRDKLMDYQRECFDVLFQHFMPRMEAAMQASANDYTRISPAQAQALSELVIAETKRTGKHYKTVWGSFNRHFRVNSYHELPAARFDEACQWLGGKRVAAQAVPPTQAPTVAPSYELPAVDFDFMRTMNDGLCDPKPINTAVRAVAQQMSWKLAAEAQVGILQFLERFISYRTNDAMRQDVSCVAPMLEKLTLSHCLAYRFFEELDRARQMAGLMQQMANTCVNSIQQRMGTVFA